MPLSNLDILLLIASIISDDENFLYSLCRYVYIKMLFVLLAAIAKPRNIIRDG